MATSTDAEGGPAGCKTLLEKKQSILLVFRLAAAHVEDTQATNRCFERDAMVDEVGCTAGPFVASVPHKVTVRERRTLKNENGHDNLMLFPNHPEPQAFSKSVLKCDKVILGETRPRSQPVQRFFVNRGEPTHRSSRGSELELVP